MDGSSQAQRSLLTVSIAVALAIIGCAGAKDPPSSATPTESSPPDEPQGPALVEKKGTLDFDFPTPPGTPPENGASSSNGPGVPVGTPDKPKPRGSAGCGRARDTAFHADLRLTVDGTERTYDLYVPKSYQPGTPVDLVFVFHGDGNPDLRASVPLESVTEGKAVIVHPYAFGAWDLSASAENYDYRFVEALRAELDGSLCVDQDRVFGYGYSNGGFFLNLYSCFRGTGVFRAIATSSGGIYAPTGEPEHYDDNGHLLCPKQPVAALVLHGTEDSEVPYDTGVYTRDTWLGAEGCSKETASVAPSPCTAYTHCAKNPVSFCAIAGGTHAIWPSTASAVWNFFRSISDPR